MNRTPDVTLPPITAEPYDVRAKGQTIDYWHALIQSLQAHEETTGSEAVIYIVDTAEQLQHDDLPTEGNQHGADFVGETSPDGHGHGHMCSGVTSGINNAEGVIGVAPGAIVVPVRGLNSKGQGFEGQITAAVAHCRTTHLQHFPDKLGIINMSFGGSREMPKLYAELKRCKEAGMIPVASAGNSGNSTGRDNVGYPGKYDDVCITVAAIGPDNTPAWFSSAGPAVDVTAYGVNILTTNHQNGYSRVNGTSFSGPMVAGIIALFGSVHIEAFKSAGACAKEMAEQFLEEHAEDLLEKGKDARTGAGRTIAMPYLRNTPKLPEDGGDNPPPPPEEEPATREERLLIFELPAVYRLFWNTMGARPMINAVDDAPIDVVIEEWELQHLSVLADSQEWQQFYLSEVTVYLKSTAYADDLEEDFLDYISRHWEQVNRGVLMRAGKDLEDAGRAGLYFCKMFAEKREGLQVEGITAKCFRAEDRLQFRVTNDL